MSEELVFHLRPQDERVQWRYPNAVAACGVTVSYVHFLHAYLWEERPWTNKCPLCDALFTLETLREG